MWGVLDKRTTYDDQKFSREAMDAFFSKVCADYQNPPQFHEGFRCGPLVVRNKNDERFAGYEHDIFVQNYPKRVEEAIEFETYKFAERQVYFLTRMLANFNDSFPFRSLQRNMVSSWQDQVEMDKFSSLLFMVLSLVGQVTSLNLDHVIANCVLSVKIFGSATWAVLLFLFSYPKWKKIANEQRSLELGKNFGSSDWERSSTHRFRLREE